MNFLQLKLILDSFSRSSGFLATRATTCQDGANESPERLTARETGCDYNLPFLGLPSAIREAGFRWKQILSATVIFLPITLRKMRSIGISFETECRRYPIEGSYPVRDNRAVIHKFKNCAQYRDCRMSDGQGLLWTQSA